MSALCRLGFFTGQTYADKLDQARIAGGEPVHLLAAVAPQQRDREAVRGAGEDAPMRAGILPAPQICHPVEAHASYHGM